MSSPWSGVARLATCNESTFHATTEPLSIMVKLAYTSTSGSYFNASEANATVAGWTRALTANPPAGMRALLFVHPGTRRAVVAFRGTDLNSSGVSGQADACADAALGAAPLPAFCGRFDNHTLDYLPRAVEFAARATEVSAVSCPRCDLLFTGHSLGASLAMMVAEVRAAAGSGAAVGSGAAPPPPAVVFSAGSWRGALRRRLGITPASSAAAGRLFALADRWDPVQERAAPRAEPRRDAVCLLPLREELTSRGGAVMSRRRP